MTFINELNKYFQISVTVSVPVSKKTKWLGFGFNISKSSGL